MFAIVDGIGELPNPVAEDEHASAAFLTRLFVGSVFVDFGRSDGLAKHQVEFDMAVAIDEEVDVGMRLKVLLRVEYQMFAVLTHVGWFLAVGTLQARMFCPALSELHAPPRVYEVEQSLTGAVVEHPPQELELPVGIAESVAVCEVEHVAIDIGREWLPVEDDAAFLL